MRVDGGEVHLEPMNRIQLYVPAVEGRHLDLEVSPSGRLIIGGDGSIVEKVTARGLPEAEEA